MSAQRHCTHYPWEWYPESPQSRYLTPDIELRSRTATENQFTKFPVLGVKYVGGILRHSRAEERAENRVCIRQLDVREDTEGSLRRRCLAKGSIIGMVSSA